MKGKERWTGNNSAGPVVLGDEDTAEAAAEKEIIFFRFIEMQLCLGAVAPE